MEELWAKRPRLYVSSPSISGALCESSSLDSGFKIAVDSLNESFISFF